ncbi:MAG: carbohydrate-binding family 9-like protein [Clostridia bacterium]|nr:carbohydrate-binding family 9-like protein [Clostridia bacterium]MBQ9785716.1 carbohydrate-binding family 9-like protein [Clostridia bacterium]
MNYYRIQKAGREIDWSAVERLEIAHKYRDTPPALCAFAQICYNDDGMHVHMWSENDDVRAKEIGPLGYPCKDSCLEFFFSPMEGDARYFNIEFNCNGCLFLGFGGGESPFTRLIHDDVDALFAPKTARTDTGWEIFYTIPYSFIQKFFPNFEIKKGKTLRANCYKCADLTAPANYLSWNPIDPAHFTFHNTECFGLMEFEV